MSAAQKKRKRSAPRPEKNIIRAPGTVLTTRHVTIEGTKSISVEKKLVGVSLRKPVAKVVAESPVESPPLEQSDGPESAEEIKKTQSAQLLDKYGDKLPNIIRFWVACKASTGVGAPCPCGNAMRNAQCRDCRQYDLSCEACWVQKHENNPFHWAHVWDAQLGYFVKHDISAVDGGTHTVVLGHHGKRCPNAANPQMMTMVDHTGIHATKLHFCSCAENPNVEDRFAQLMEAGFFAGSTNTVKSRAQN
ncbi:hypothetical protein C8R44DRAFT_867172 [Mycena epipterygia]|nr:hypothetical protein C8R44DRAFT_867172 [Mycena epipterygia]